MTEPRFALHRPAGDLGAAALPAVSAAVGLALAVTVVLPAPLAVLLSVAGALVTATHVGATALVLRRADAKHRAAVLAVAALLWVVAFVSPRSALSLVVALSPLHIALQAAWLARVWLARGQAPRATIVLVTAALIAAALLVLVAVQAAPATPLLWRAAIPASLSRPVVTTLGVLCVAASVLSLVWARSHRSAWGVVALSSLVALALALPPLLAQARGVVVDPTALLAGPLLIGHALQGLWLAVTFEDRARVVAGRAFDRLAFVLVAFLVGGALWVVLPFALWAAFERELASTTLSTVAALSLCHMVGEVWWWRRRQAVVRLALLDDEGFIASGTRATPVRSLSGPRAALLAVPVAAVVVVALVDGARAYALRDDASDDELMQVAAWFPRDVRVRLRVPEALRPPPNVDTTRDDNEAAALFAAAVDFAALQAHLERGALDDAAAVARAAPLSFSEPPALTVAAQTLRRAGDLDEAAAFIARGLRHAPGDAGLVAERALVEVERALLGAEDNGAALSAAASSLPALEAALTPAQSVDVAWAWARLRAVRGDKQGARAAAAVALERAAALGDGATAARALALRARSLEESELGAAIRDVQQALRLVLGGALRAPSLSPDEAALWLDAESAVSRLDGDVVDRGRLRLACALFAARAAERAPPSERRRVLLLAAAEAEAQAALEAGDAAAAVRADPRAAVDVLLGLRL